MRAIRLAMLLIALAFPGMARAECLGDGCYDGLLAILILLALGALAIVALAVWLVIRLVRRARRNRRAL
jgi:hypothetical protein